MDTSLEFLAILRQEGIRFFAGVPDSVLKGLSTALDLRTDIQHLPAANEGAAVGLAIGWHLAKQDVPAVYMQCSGLWNALNPYFTLAHHSVYDIPLLLIVGWRGVPGRKDEPQHMATGAETQRVFAMMGITPFVVREWDAETKRGLSQYVGQQRDNRCSAAILIPAGVLDDSSNEIQKESKDESPARAEVIRQLLPHIAPQDLIVAGIGHTGRALYATRLEAADPLALDRDFLCVGGMGYASQVAIGVALANAGQRVWCLEGDGSFLMHLGCSALVGELDNLNLLYVLLDNGSHASVGGQKTAAKSPEYSIVARALGFRTVERASSLSELDVALGKVKAKGGPCFLWVRIRSEPDLKLPRPQEDLVGRKQSVMALLAKGSSTSPD